MGDGVKLGMDDPNHRRRMAAAMYSANAADWTRRAACANDLDKLHDDDYHDSFFPEEPGRSAKVRFSEPILRRLKICSGCPVRAECLAAAYRQEVHLEAIPSTAPVRYRWVEDGYRFGIRGGVPGRVRERYARHPDRLRACERWFAALARKRKWATAGKIASLWGANLAPSSRVGHNSG